MPDSISMSSILKPRRLGSSEIVQALKGKEVHIYIAGPISFVEELQDYRKSIKEGLLKISERFIIHDPWEREQSDFKGINFPDIENAEEKKQLSEEIITKDLDDILKCDIVIAYLFRPGNGTAMEMFFQSRVLRKPVVLIYTVQGESDSCKVPLWLYGHANLIFSSKRGMYSWLRKTLEEIEDEKKERP